MALRLQTQDDLDRMKSNNLSTWDGKADFFDQWPAARSLKSILGFLRSGLLGGKIRILTLEDTTAGIYSI